MLPMQTIPLPERADPKLQRERDVPEARRRREDKRKALRDRGRAEQALDSEPVQAAYVPNLMQQAGRVPGPKDFARSHRAKRQDDDLAGFEDVPDAPAAAPAAPVEEDLSAAGFKDEEMEFKAPAADPLAGFQDVPDVATVAMEEEKDPLAGFQDVPAAGFPAPVAPPAAESFEDQLLREAPPQRAERQVAVPTWAPLIF